MKWPGVETRGKSGPAGAARRMGGHVLRFLISGGLIYYIFSRQETGIASVAGQLRALDWRFLALGLAGFKACVLLGSLRWKILMNAHRIDAGFVDALALNYLGMFFNNFMLSLTGGDIVKAYYASRLEKKKRAVSATIVFLDRVMGLAALLFMAGVSLLAFAGRERQRVEFLVVIAGIALCVFLGIILFNRRAAAVLGKTFVLPRFRPALRKVYDAVYYYKRSKRALVFAFLLSIALWSFMILINVVLGRGLGIDRGAAYYFSSIPAIMLISSIPVSIRGWGIREFLYGRFFGLESGPALSIIFALLEIFLSLTGGVLFMLHLPMKKWNREGSRPGLP